MEMWLLITQKGTKTTCAYYWEESSVNRRGKQENLKVNVDFLPVIIPLVDDPKSSELIRIIELKKAVIEGAPGTWKHETNAQT